MEGQFSVAAGGRQVGKVLVHRQGLYYHFLCRCCLDGDIMYRLLVTCGTVRENLGILVPTEGSFVLNRKLPVKRIGEGKLSFTLVPIKEEATGTFIPIKPEEPFAYISRLKTSFLIMQNGQPGICIEKLQEC